MLSKLPVIFILLLLFYQSVSDIHIVVIDGFSGREEGRGTDTTGLGRV